MECIDIFDLPKGRSEVAGCDVFKDDWGRITVYHGKPVTGGFSSRALNYERIETPEQFLKFLEHPLVKQAITLETRVNLHFVEQSTYSANAKQLGIDLKNVTVGEILKMMQNENKVQKPKFFTISFTPKDGKLPTSCTL